MAEAPSNIPHENGRLHPKGSRSQVRLLVVYTNDNATTEFLRFHSYVMTHSP